MRVMQIRFYKEAADRVVAEYQKKYGQAFCRKSQSDKRNRFCYIISNQPIVKIPDIKG